MAVDISKVFKANIKAIRINQSSDGSATGNNSDALNQELNLKANKSKAPKLSDSVSKEAKNIVSVKIDSCLNIWSEIWN